MGWKLSVLGMAEKDDTQEWNITMPGIEAALEREAKGSLRIWGQFDMHIKFQDNHRDPAIDR